MIKHLSKPWRRGNWYFAPVAYSACDWCLWPVAVFNEKAPEGHCRLLSLQWLKWGVGIAWQIGRSR